MKKQKQKKIFETKEEVNYPQEYDFDSPIVVILDDLKETELKYPWTNQRLNDLYQVTYILL